MSEWQLVVGWSSHDIVVIPKASLRDARNSARKLLARGISTWTIERRLVSEWTAYPTKVSLGGPRPMSELEKWVASRQSTVADDPGVSDDGEGDFSAC